MVDVITVTDDSLEVLEPSGDRTPIAKLLNGEDLPLAEKHCRPQKKLANAQIKNSSRLLIGGVIIP